MFEGMCITAAAPKRKKAIPGDSLFTMYLIVYFRMSLAITTRCISLVPS